MKFLSIGYKPSKSLALSSCACHFVRAFIFLKKVSEKIYQKTKHRTKNEIISFSRVKTHLLVFNFVIILQSLKSFGLSKEMRGIHIFNIKRNSSE